MLRLSALNTKGLMKNIILILLFNIFFMSNNLCEAGKFQPQNSSKWISLKSAIEEGVRKNPDEQIRQFDYSLLELTYKDTHEKFWYPNIALKMTNQNQRVLPIKSSSNRDTLTSKSANTTFGLQLGQYTVFNWGKDYLHYINKKNLFKRAKTELSEEKIRLKHNIIIQYFTLVKAIKYENIYREQLRNTSFVFRLSTERVRQRKISTQEYYQIRAEYLRAQIEYQNSKVELAQENENMAKLLGDNLARRYRTTDGLKYIPTITDLNYIITKSRQQNPKILMAKTIHQNTIRSIKIADRNNLPLPKFDLNLGTYSHTLGRNGSATKYETLNGNDELELVASIDMTWPLLGKNGLFNSRRNKKAFINERKANVYYKNAVRTTELRVRQLFSSLKLTEKQIELVQMQIENAHKSYDKTLDNYMARKTRFVVLKDMLLNLRDSQITLQKRKLQHLKQKIGLAWELGVDELPGENFANLAEREVIK